MSDQPKNPNNNSNSDGNNASHSNALANENSLYLRAHAENPIDWHPWGDKALELARTSQRPIFLSIGYSSCHWCHVMEREAFSSEEVAEFLNEHFVSIKVDREEYPDIDQLYQSIMMRAQGRGGWPLSVFLTPKLEPFYIGTYFPLDAGDGMPGFREMLEQLHFQYTDSPEALIDEGVKVLDQVLADPKVEQKVDYEGDFPSAASILHALQDYQDIENGGYGQAPKFPQYSFYEWALEHTYEGVVPQELNDHIFKTVETISLGGVCDHARGGVHRYSVDAKWLVPHFEKMLYDQAGFLKLYAKASIVANHPVFLDHLAMTLDYLRTEMQSDHGYFFSAQDADSEGIEGLYYTFTEEEVEEALSDFAEDLVDEAATIKKWLGVSTEGNFDHKLNVVSLNANELEEMLKPENWQKMRDAKAALMDTRATRIPPLTDSKGVASWNFMLITGVCDVIHHCGIEEIRKLAQEVLDSSIKSIHDTFVSIVDGKTKITHVTTKDVGVDYLEDYVFFAEAHDALYRVTGQDQFRHNIINSLNYIEENFFDGKFLYSRNLKQKGIAYGNQPAALYDQSYRSAAATFLYLCRKWSFGEKKPLTQELEKFLETAKELCLQNPLAHGQCLRALTFPSQAYRTVEVPRTWLKESEFWNYYRRFSPRFVFLFGEGDAKSGDWQICLANTCEASGKGLKSFIEGINQE